MNLLDASALILSEAGEPLHYRDITERALARDLLDTTGATPEASLNARLAVDIKRKGAASPFMRTAPGVFALRAWGLAPAPAPAQLARTSHVPTWAALRAYLQTVHGRPASELTALRVAIRELRGEGRDFTQPEVWVPEALEGAAQQLGLALWKRSKGGLNPRYIAHAASTASGHGLLAEDAAGRLQLTAAGRDLVDHPTGDAVRQLDADEGVAQVLALVAEHGPARSGELLAPWTAWCHRHSGIRSESTARISLGARLANLQDRQLVARSGGAWATTPAGLSWLGEEAEALVGDDAPEDKDELLELMREIGAQRDRVRERIKAAVSAMDPYAFEHLIKRLLDEMNYQEVEVTKAAGDKGVDVVGRIQVGITEVTEVIQAKRQKANVGRPVLDALRGSLYRWSAQRGTIITTAAFSKGARKAAFDIGAAPIQLIDGDRLVELLIENGIGVKQQPVKLWRFDAEPFEGGLEGDEEG